MKIEMFRGEYRFLSNFYEAPVEYRGLRYGSNEAAFQAQKCLTEEERREFTLLRRATPRNAAAVSSSGPTGRR